MLLLRIPSWPLCVSDNLWLTQYYVDAVSISFLILLHSFKHRIWFFFPQCAFNLHVCRFESRSHWLWTNQRLIISERRVRRPQGKNGLVNLMNTQFCIFYLNRQTQMKADPRSPGVILRHRNKSIFRDKKTRKVENYIQERILSKNYINLTSRLLKKSYPLCLCRLWSHLNWKPIH